MDVDARAREVRTGIRTCRGVCLYAFRGCSVRCAMLMNIEYRMVGHGRLPRPSLPWDPTPDTSFSKTHPNNTAPYARSYVHSDTQCFPQTPLFPIPGSRVRPYPSASPLSPSVRASCFPRWELAVLFTAGIGRSDDRIRARKRGGGGGPRIEVQATTRESGAQTLAS